MTKNQDPVFKRDLKASGNDPTERLRNIYRVLLTRGMKGTFVYFLDPETRRHFEELLVDAWLPVGRQGSRLLLRRDGQGRVQDLETGEMTPAQPLEYWFTVAEWQPTETVTIHG